MKESEFMRAVDDSSVGMQLGKAFGRKNSVYIIYPSVIATMPSAPEGYCIDRHAVRGTAGTGRGSELGELPIWHHSVMVSRV